MGLAASKYQITCKKGIVLIKLGSGNSNVQTLIENKSQQGTDDVQDGLVGTLLIKQEIMSCDHISKDFLSISKASSINHSNFHCVLMETDRSS
jgi:hypothetical protein